MDSTIKECTNCKGTGRVNGRYEDHYENKSWIPTDGEWVRRYVEDTCPKCNGKGKLKLTWVPNDIPDHERYASYD